MARVEGADTSTDLGSLLRALREQSNLSMRQLAKEAGVSPGYIARVESGSVSPTIASLSKLLAPLGVDMGDFFAGTNVQREGYVFRREEMRVAFDTERRYLFVLPQRPDVHLEIIDELILPHAGSDFGDPRSDVAGYILSGEIHIQTDNETDQVLQANDAFYVPAGHVVHVTCTGKKSASLVTIRSRREADEGVHRQARPSPDDDAAT